MILAARPGVFSRIRGGDLLQRLIITTVRSGREHSTRLGDLSDCLAVFGFIRRASSCLAGAQHPNVRDDSGRLLVGG